MSTDEKIHPITGDISESDKDLEHEKAEGTTVEDKTKQIDPTTTEQMKEKHTPLRPRMHKDGGQIILESCKEQEGRVERECGNSSVSAIENRENGKDERSSKPFQGQDPVKKQEKSPVLSTIPAETKECETEIASKVTDEVNNQMDEKQTTSETSEDSKDQENGDENGSKPSEDSKDLEMKSLVHPNPTSKEEAGNNAETSEDVKKQERRKWFHFPRSSKVEKSPKNEGQEMDNELKKEDKHYDIRHVNVGGSYLLAIGLVFVCVAVILGGFFWRIGYAVGGYHEDPINTTTACPTLDQPSNDYISNHVVLKALKKMWRNESDDVFLTENNIRKRS